LRIPTLRCRFSPVSTRIAALEFPRLTIYLAGLEPLAVEGVWKPVWTTIGSVGRN